MLCITDPQSENHDQEILSSGQFLPQTDDFRYNRRITPMDFGRKFEFFQNV
jgi:hypothetical protein